jgi:hypothetical protein
MKNVPANKIPSFTKSAKALLSATNGLDNATAKFSSAICLNLQQYLDVCSMAGIVRNHAGCAAIGKAVRENETMVKAWFHDGTLQQKTVTEYAQGMMRAYFHNVPFTQGLKNDPDMKIPKANGDTSKPTGPKAGGKIQSTNRAELDKTICKLLTQARLIGLTEFAATILDVCLDGLDGFKETQDAPL